jgi:hypothetical protein
MPENARVPELRYYEGGTRSGVGGRWEWVPIQAAGQGRAAREASRGQPRAAREAIRAGAGPWKGVKCVPFVLLVSLSLSLLSMYSQLVRCKTSSLVYCGVCRCY